METLFMAECILNSMANHAIFAIFMCPASSATTNSVFTIQQITDSTGCSPNTVDVFNPKTIQATMGGIARVKVYYTALPDLMHSLGNVPVYGTLLDGENMYEQPLSKNGIIIMGNEGNGISPEIEKLVNRKLYIPNYPAERETSESLNVAIATAIVCAEFRRQAAL